MVKELRTVQDDVQCEVCGRTILKGERPENYLAPGGTRRLVCELCTGRAEQEGWIRESAAGDMPVTTRRREPRRSLLSRLRTRREEGELAPEDEWAPAEGWAEEALEDDMDAVEPATPAPEPAAAEPPRRRRREARHVRAVPTNAEVKVERAIEVFNESEFPRKIAGITRSLGEPWVSATPDAASPSEVTVIVAWELSWYRYRVDLGDADEPVLLVSKGLELDEIEPELKEWNASAAADGRLGVGVGSDA
ncbi:MAG: hypothetical protein WD844_17130 [Thermoleophilaceae bacterium]